MVLAHVYFFFFSLAFTNHTFAYIGTVLASLHYASRNYLTTSFLVKCYLNSKINLNKFVIATYSHSNFCLGDFVPNRLAETLHSSLIDLESKIMCASFCFTFFKSGIVLNSSTNFVLAFPDDFFAIMISAELLIDDFSQHGILIKWNFSTTSNIAADNFVFVLP
jgi:hypothetical protein